MVGHFPLSELPEIVKLNKIIFKRCFEMRDRNICICITSEVCFSLIERISHLTSLAGKPASLAASAKCRYKTSLSQKCGVTHHIRVSLALPRLSSVFFDKHYNSVLEKSTRSQ